MTITHVTINVYNVFYTQLYWRILHLINAAITILAFIILSYIAMAWNVRMVDFQNHLSGKNWAHLNI